MNIIRNESDFYMDPSPARSVVAQRDVEREPGFFAANAHYAYAEGGPLTRAFLDRLSFDGDWNDAIIDSRSHMLMPGFYPCIPGWHHDDVERTREDGQPNYHDPTYRPNHAMLLLGHDVSTTEFARGVVELPEPELGKVIYKEWDQLVNDAVADGRLEVEKAKMGHIAFFDNMTMHRGVAASGFGWRWFARATIGSRRKVENKIRYQTQVYIADPSVSW